MSNQEYLSTLNKSQLKAVQSIEGPNLVIAGAGTGKTRVLTTRVAHIIDTQNAFPSQILCVTFTNKAAREMSDRIQKLVDNKLERMPWMGTFHSIGAKIIRNHSELLGLKTSFTILDKDDQLSLIKQIIKAENLDQAIYVPKFIQNKIDQWKNKALNPQDIKTDSLDSMTDDKSHQIYQIYQKRLFEINCLDFGDLLLQCINLFSNVDIIKRYSSNFKYILVDEYQDTNAAQYIWLKKLASTHNNICCVGDDDQSIYSWRGAEVDNMIRFEKDFDNASTIRLEQNYRSTNNILKSASSLISYNSVRLGKELHSDQGNGDPIFIHQTNSSKDEATMVAQEVMKYKDLNPDLNNIAVLVRAVFQSREIEEAMIRYSIPYRIIGGIRFYERSEIKDAVSYLRLVFEEHDDIAFERAIMNPKRGVGEKSFNHLISVAKNQNIPLLHAARLVIGTDEVSKKVSHNLEMFNNLILQAQNMIENSHYYDILKFLLDESGYMNMLKNDKNVSAQSKIENLKELLVAMQDYASIEEFLEHISLVTSIDENNEDNKVSLMTLHAAKGLEYNYVFLPGWEEGLFPHQKTIDETGNKGIEEERRLAYVGITRARKIVNISTSLSRRFQNNWMPSLQSRFIEELDENLVKHINHVSDHIQNFGMASIDEFNQEYSAEPKRLSKRISPGIEYKTIMDIEEEENSRDINDETYLQIGQTVKHSKFGIGTIKDIDGPKAIVKFDNHGTKKLISSFLRPL